MTAVPTALSAHHSRWGAKMVDFCGYRLPLFYGKSGVIAEHLHTREHASLFDVSHMGQLQIDASALSALSYLIPADLSTLPAGQAKYTFLTNNNGGIIDDCIIGNDGSRGWFMVVNACRKSADIRHLSAYLPDPTVLHERTDLSLIAVSGPMAEEVVGILFPQAKTLSFMQSIWINECRIFRGGYTGEDGFELSIPNNMVADLVESLAAKTLLAPAGLGARDSLRLEAGLCLYGSDIDETTTPVEAGLLWAIPKHRRDNQGFVGSSAIYKHVIDPPQRRLVGLLPQSKTPVRSGTLLYARGEVVGQITSGLFSPSLRRPIAMGYVPSKMVGELTAIVRGKEIICERATMPFIAHRYVRISTTEEEA